LLEVFGELESFDTIMGIERPKVNLIDLENKGKVVDTITKDTPDNISLQGRFKSGALLNYGLRSAAPFPGDAGMRWTINGDKGEILVTCPSAMFDINHEGVKIQLHELSNDKAEDIELPKDDLADLSSTLHKMLADFTRHTPRETPSLTATGTWLSSAMS
jgi:hypothetical protein